MRQTLCFAGLCVMAALQTANAADNDDVEPIIVTATRTATPESEVASSITVITAAEIARWPDRGIHARDEFKPHQSTARWDRRGRSEHAQRVI